MEEEMSGNRELHDLRSNESLLRVVADPQHPGHQNAVEELLLRLAENQRLREALERIEKKIPPPSVDPVLLGFTAAIRNVAREALAGDAE
jgi:hypothetical protein